ncbi:MAG: N-acetyltransferase [Nitrososphaerota archaeon]
MDYASPPRSIRIEQASLDDLEELYDLERKCFGGDAYTRSILRLLLIDPSSIPLKAVNAEGELVGSAIGRIEKIGGKVLGRVYTLDVRPDFRRRGIGAALLKRLEEEFRRLGCEKVVLEVAVDNEPAISLYKSLGYEFTSRLKDYYGRGRDAYRAEKDL